MSMGHARGGADVRRLPRVHAVSLVLLATGPSPPSSPPELRRIGIVQAVPYEIVDRTTVNDAWDGSPMVLAVNQNARMQQTPAGSMVFSYLNLATQNNLGELAVTSGGGPPTSLLAFPLTTQPGIWVNNWNGDNLSVTNVSINTSTPIRIQAIGPGMPGTTPLPLPIGDPMALAPGQSAQGPTQPRFMQVMVQATSGARSVVAIIGGPPDTTGNTAKVISVNDSANTGPGTNPPPPPGYYATTTNNSYTLTFNWGGADIFVANLSATVAPAITLVLRAL